MTVIKKISLGKLFDKKWFSVLISGIVAVVLWLVITVMESPDSENIIGGLKVSIPIENTVVSEMGMDIIGDPSIYTASVTVKGPAYVVSDLKSEDILVTASISNVTNSGVYSLELRAAKQASADGNFEIVSISPRTLNVEFDYIDTKQFEVVVQAIGHKAVKGLVSELPFVSDSNNAVLNFKGARSDIEKISKVVAVAEVNKTLSETETFKSELKVYDKDGNELNKDDFTITAADGVSAPDIQITVPIYKEKTVPIEAQFINAPKAFSTKNIAHTLEQKTVTISGPPEAVDNIASVKLSEIDFYQISGNNQKFETTLLLPEGVKNKDNIETVTVQIIGLDNYSVNTVTVSKLVSTNSSISAKLTRTIRNVKVIGPDSAFDNISSSDFYAEVNLDGLESGEHTVSVRIVCTASDRVWQIGTYTASVNIE